jgi:hypothetical protein
MVEKGTKGQETKHISAMLEAMLQKPVQAEISMQEIKEFFHARGFLIMLVLSAGPSVIPLPPGFSCAPGILIVIFSLQMLLGYKSPWLPKWLGRKTISHSLLSTIITKLTPYLRMLERVMKPRLSFLCIGQGEKLIVILCLLSGFAVFLPIPFSNAIPSLGVVIMALGLMMRDGLTVLAGVVISLIGLTIASTVIWLSIGAIKFVIFNFLGLGSA